jgi:GDP-4-dehydro-6-deoxy-D-mannose reductase
MTEKRALITGISGFVGSHLQKELLAKGWDLHGLLMPKEFDEFGNSELGYKPLKADLSDLSALEEAIKKTATSHIVHMAAASAPSLSFKNPELFFQVNVMGTQNILEAARRYAPEAKITIFSSADIYGITPAELMPLTESTPLNPLNPYAASKAACHHIARQYVLNFGLTINEIRPFNMIGPGQNLGFVLPDWSYQVAKIIKQGAAASITVGGLESQRDFVDVRDAVRGMADIIELGANNEVYQICKGEGVSIQLLLDLLLQSSGREIAVKQNPDLMRPSKMPVLFGSSAKLHQLSGWQAEISLAETVQESLNWWLDKL